MPASQRNPAAAPLFPFLWKYPLTAPRPGAIHISMKLEIASSQLEALGSPIRLKVYRLLVRAGLEGLPVGAVQEKLGMAASTLSHHIRKLIDTGLVTQERQGTTLISRADFNAMRGLIGYLTEECCTDASCAPSPRAAASSARCCTPKTARASQRATA